MSTIVYDLIVVGGGPVGLATAYEAAKADLSVMVLEQNNFFNQAGSSGDLARMYRTMYAMFSCLRARLTAQGTPKILWLTWHMIRWTFGLSSRRKLVLHYAQ